MPADQIARSRFVRGLLLDLLGTADAAGAGFGLRFDQIRTGVSRSRIEASPAELRRELNDTVDDKLARRKWDDAFGSNMYTITSRGRDFRRADMPWDRIDDFSGTVP